MVNFHFYYPRRVDILEGNASIEVLRKRYKVKRMWIRKEIFQRCYGIDEKNGIYIFGKMPFEELIDTINHEMIHFVIDRLIGDYVSTQLDNVDASIWEK